MRYTDEVYGSLAYDGASLLRVLVCVSRALLVIYTSQPFISPMVCKSSTGGARSPVSDSK